MHGDKSAIIRKNKAWIIEQYSRGDVGRPTTESLANQLGVGRKFVDWFLCQWRKAGDLPRRPRFVLDEDKDLIIELYRSGLSPQQIADKWEVHRCCVRDSLIRWGVK